MRPGSMRRYVATKKANPHKHFTQNALDVVRKATGETTAPAPSKKPESGRKKSTARDAPPTVPKT